MTGAPDTLSPRAAMSRWLDKKRASLAESTIRTHYYRLKLFVEWCDEQEIDRMKDLTGWDLDEYEVHRRGEGVAPSTLHNEQKTLRQWLQYLGGIGVVDDGLHEAVDVPELSDADASNDTRLTTDAATAFLAHYRDSPGFGSRGHVLLELAWTIGARVGGLRALDLRDVDLDDAHATFQHRPETDTPLKNGRGGERVVGLLPEVVDALESYINGHRIEIEDDAGRQPLLTGQRGRPTPGSIRDWMYEATQPCHYGPCPHDREPSACDWRAYNAASKCPSSRSPHQVRTGSITWQLNRGLPVEVVAERVNATIEVIQRHYDKEHAVDEMEERRRPWLDNLSIDDNHETEQ
jgi:site-specific recombinase XerD